MKKKKINEQKSTVQEILATEMSCGIIRFAANVVEDIFKKKKMRLGNINKHLLNKFLNIHKMLFDCI